MRYRTPPPALHGYTRDAYTELGHPFSTSSQPDSDHVRISAPVRRTHTGFQAIRRCFRSTSILYTRSPEKLSRDCLAESECVSSAEVTEKRVLWERREPLRRSEAQRPQIHPDQDAETVGSRDAVVFGTSAAETRSREGCDRFA